MRALDDGSASKALRFFLDQASLYYEAFRFRSDRGVLWGFVSLLALDWGHSESLTFKEFLMRLQDDRASRTAYLVKRLLIDLQGDGYLKLLQAGRPVSSHDEVLAKTSISREPKIERALVSHASLVAERALGRSAKLRPSHARNVNAAAFGFYREKYRPAWADFFKGVAAATQTDVSLVRRRFRKSDTHWLLVHLLWARHLEVGSEASPLYMDDVLHELHRLTFVQQKDVVDSLRNLRDLKLVSVTVRDKGNRNTYAFNAAVASHLRPYLERAVELEREFRDSVSRAVGNRAPSSGASNHRSAQHS